MDRSCCLVLLWCISLPSIFFEPLTDFQPQEEHLTEEAAGHHGKDADAAVEAGDEEDEDPVPDALMHYRHQ